MVVPKGWSVDKIAKQFDLFAGGDVDKFCYSAYKTDVYCYPIYSNSLNNFGLYGYTSKAKYSSNSITITGRGFVGVAMFRNRDFDAIIRLLVLTPKNAKINCRFVAEYINQYINFPIESTGVPQLTIPQIKDINILLPPLAEQAKIAEALSDIDELIYSLEKLIDKKKAIKQGAMQELLTGKNRLEGFTGEWVEKTCGEVVNINMGQSPNSKYYNIKNNGLPLIQGNADIESRVTIIRFYTSQIIKTATKGDILLTVRAPVGSVAKVLFNCCIGRGVCSLSYPNEYMYQYLIFIENSWHLLSKGSTFDSINTNEINSLKIKLPPTIEEQTAIAAILSDMDGEIDALAQKLCKCRTIKQGMMQELLTGRIRLV